MDATLLPAVESLLHTLGDLSPLALIVLIVAGAAWAVRKSGPLMQIKDNHLKHIELHLSTIAANTSKTNEKLEDIAIDIAFVKGKVD